MGLCWQLLPGAGGPHAGSPGPSFQNPRRPGCPCPTKPMPSPSQAKGPTPRTWSAPGLRHLGLRCRVQSHCVLSEAAVCAVQFAMCISHGEWPGLMRALGLLPARSGYPLLPLCPLLSDQLHAGRVTSVGFNPRQCQVLKGRLQASSDQPRLEGQSLADLLLDRADRPWGAQREEGGPQLEPQRSLAQNRLAVWGPSLPTGEGPSEGLGKKRFPLTKASAQAAGTDLGTRGSCQAGGRADVVTICPTRP